MYRILLVEDSAEYQLIVARALANTDVSVVKTATRAEAIAAIVNGLPDIVIMDLSLPDGDGFQALEELRQAGMPVSTPVFFLTSESELSAKLTAFHLGADDYLVKPINPAELRARVDMRLRKTQNTSADILSFGLLSLDLKQLRVSIRENDQTQVVSLTAKEYRILSFLAQNPDEVFTREQIVESIWGKDVHILGRTVDSHIYGLRKKMGAAGQYIESVAGLGYRFNGHPERASA